MHNGDMSLLIHVKQRKGCMLCSIMCAWCITFRHVGDLQIPCVRKWGRQKLPITSHLN